MDGWTEEWLNGYAEMGLEAQPRGGGGVVKSDQLKKRMEILGEVFYPDQIHVESTTKVICESKYLNLNESSLQS